MIDAWHDALIDGHEDGDSEIAGIGGGAYLVEDDSQLAFLPSQADHRLDEIVAKGTIEPSSTDNHRPPTGTHGLLFAFKLRATIGAVGTYAVSLHVGYMISAVKDIICRNLNEPTASTLNSLGQIGRCCGIEQCTEFYVRLSLVYSSIGGTIDDAVNLMFLDKGLYGFTISDVQFLYIRIKIHMLGMSFLQQLHFVSQLAITSRNQYIHLLFSLDTNFTKHANLYYFVLIRVIHAI